MVREFCNTFGIEKRRSSELVFLLNCGESKAIMCVPYTVVFGRPPTLPVDIFLDMQEGPRFTDGVTPKDFSEEMNFALKDMFQYVIKHLQ